MNGVLLVCGLVIVLIVVVTVAHWRKPSRQRRRARKCRDQSSGYFDEAAADALRAVEEIPASRRTSEDRYLAANIRDLNLTGGDIANATRHTAAQIFDDYMMAMDMAVNEQANGVRGAATTPVHVMVGVGGFIERNRPYVGVDFVNAFTNANAQVTTRDTQTRVQEAATSATTRAEFTDRFVRASTAHTPDPQSVHDSAVNVSLRHTVDLLRTTNPIKVPFSRCVREANDWIDDRADVSDECKQYARRALGGLNPNNTISTLASDEGEIFSLVWSRTHDPANADRMSTLRDNIVSGLADFYERGADGRLRDSPVCINGRCGRLLESLALGDHDSSISGALTVEERKNAVYEDVKKILAAEIATAKASDNADMQAVGRSYDDPEVVTKPEAESAFRDTVHRRIDDSLANHSQYFTPEIFQSVSRDAHAAVV